MQASVAPQLPPSPPRAAYLGAVASYFLQPVRIVRAYRRDYLRADLMAGLTVGVVSLPQGIAFALLAGLPAEMGIYTAIVAAIVGALWGSSNQLSTGPSNSSSLLVFSILLPIAVPGSPLYISAAGLLALMAGALRVVMGMARLGVLINFVSDSVIVGFTAGAGVLIIVGQLRALLGLDFPNSPRLIDTASNIALHIQDAHLLSTLIGLGTIAATILIKRFRKNWPAPLIAMGLAALAVAIFDLPEYGVAVLSSLTRSLPPVADLSALNANLVADLSTGALAVAVIGLVEAMSIARAIAAQTGQRLDSNQEFIGQGLANVAAGVFTGYPASGSFNRSALNLESGAQTPMASVFSGLVVLVVVLAFAPLAIYVPLSAIAALLIISAYSMINRKEMARIWQGAQGDRLIMVATIASTLFLPLQFAVLVGVLMSLVYYIWRTSLPRVYPVVPDAHFKHLVPQDRQQPACPQLGILEIRGDLYFGAAPNVEDVIVPCAAIASRAATSSWCGCRSRSSTSCRPPASSICWGAITSWTTTLPSPASSTTCSIRPFASTSVRSRCSANARICPSRRCQTASCCTPPRQPHAPSPPSRRARCGIRCTAPFRRRSTTCASRASFSALTFPTRTCCLSPGY